MPKPGTLTTPIYAFLSATCFALVLWPMPASAAEQVFLQGAQVEMQDEYPWDSGLIGLLSRGNVLEIVPDVQFCLQGISGQLCSPVCNNSRTCVLQGRMQVGDEIEFIVADIDEGGSQLMAQGRIDLTRCPSGRCSVRTEHGTANFQLALQRVSLPERRPPPTPSKRPPPAASKPPTAPADTPESAPDTDDACTVTTNPDLDAAAKEALTQARRNSDADGVEVEYGGIIVRLKNGAIKAGTPQRGLSDEIHGCTMLNGLVKDGYAIWTGSDGDCCLDARGNAWPKNEYNNNCRTLAQSPNYPQLDVIATYHTHPPSPWFWVNDVRSLFSASDMQGAYRQGIPIYMLTPDCVVRVYTPNKDLWQPAVWFGDMLDPRTWRNESCRTKELDQRVKLPSCT